MLVSALQPYTTTQKQPTSQQPTTQQPQQQQLPVVYTSRKYDGVNVCRQDVPSMIVSVRSMIECSVRCRQSDSCTGFNVMMNPRTTTCQIYNYLQLGGAYTPISGCTYYQVMYTCILNLFAYDDIYARTCNWRVFLIDSGYFYKR